MTAACNPEHVDEPRAQAHPDARRPDERLARPAARAGTRRAHRDPPGPGPFSADRGAGSSEHSAGSANGAKVRGVPHFSGSSRVFPAINCGHSGGEPVSKHPTEHIRTIALVGQSGSGKTTLAEALLVRAGAIPAAGSVERGTTVCDYQPLEKSVGHSLKMAVASFEPQGAHAGHRIHLLDTPGYPDFLGHSLPALAAVETAAIVINAQNGIEMMTGRFMQWAQKRNLDRLIIVNKIDADNVDCEELLVRIQQTFGRECLPLNLPAAGRSKVSDCFFTPAGDADFSSVEEAHRRLIDQVVEVDEKLMERYLEKGEVT